MFMILSLLFLCEVPLKNISDVFVGLMGKLNEIIHIKCLIEWLENRKCLRIFNEFLL